MSDRVGRRTGAVGATVRAGVAARSRARSIAESLAVAMHVLVAALLALSAWRSWSGPRWGTVLCAVFGLTYVAGTVAARHRRVGARARAAWLVLVTVVWAGLVVVVPDAAYLAFPLYFLCLATLGLRAGSAGVVVVMAVAVGVLGARRGLSAGGVIGPVLGAVVAIGIMAGMTALERESAERKRMIDELVETRAELAVRQREAGREAERARLAAEIHDTVAQGLASISMLLHAVERSDPQHRSIEQIRLARGAAVENLAETRRLLAALPPAALEGASLDQALARLAERTEAAHPGVRVRTAVAGDVRGLPIEVSSALLRIVQEATTNAVRHGRPEEVSTHVEVGARQVRVDVADDGRGLDPAAPRSASSFGLGGMRDRVEALGGRLDLESAPGHGCCVTAVVPLGPTGDQEVLR